MYAQLGEIIFTGIYGFSDLSFDGDEANFAEFALVNRKAALQFTGLTLTEVSATINMNVAFCSIDQQLKAMRTYKDKAEVLPLLMGNGQLLGDFVIVSMPMTVNESFADGTHKSISVSLTLKEYVSVNKLEQKQLAARRSALAVGDKKPISLRSPQPFTPAKAITTDISAAKQQANKVDQLVKKIESNHTVITADKIVNTARKGKASIESLVNRLDNNLEVLTDNPDLKTAAQSVLGSFNNVITAYPFNNIVTTVSKNSELQSTTRSLSRLSNSLLQKIIIRK